MRSIKCSRSARDFALLNVHGSWYRRKQNNVHQMFPLFSIFVGFTLLTNSKIVNGSSRVISAGNWFGRITLTVPPSSYARSQHTSLHNGCVRLVAVHIKGMRTVDAVAGDAVWTLQRCCVQRVHRCHACVKLGAVVHAVPLLQTHETHNQCYPST